MSVRRVSRSLRLRLALLVTVAAAVVIATASYLDVRTFEQTVETDRLQAAAATARAVADDLELRDGSNEPADTHELLHDFLSVTPALRDIAVVRRRGDELTLFARTLSGSVGMEGVDAAARRAIERGGLTWVGDGRERTVAVPVMQQREVAGAVAVTVSLGPLAQVGARGRQVTLWFAVAATVVLVVLMDLLVQRFVQHPISGIRETMRRAGAGEVGARVRVERPDEIGEVAEGLNEMLARLERYQTELETRVAHTTGELRETHAELVESYQHIFALREALAHAERMAALGQMAANVAHQVGTPLNLISGYVQVMKEEAHADPSALHRLQTVEAQIRKVTDAIRTMLDSARRPVPQRQPVDVGTLAEQVCEVSRPALRAANVDLRLEVQRPLPTAFVDPVQLELALFNLVSNSLDAMPHGGRLEIALSATHRGIRLVVSDSGTGVPPEVLPRIFEPWVTTKPAGRGTGLGLSITRDTITSHGGTIVVRSEPERGTVFTIDLPAAETAAAGGARA